MRREGRAKVFVDQLGCCCREWLATGTVGATHLRVQHAIPVDVTGDERGARLLVVLRVRARCSRPVCHFPRQLEDIQLEAPQIAVAFIFCTLCGRGIGYTSAGAPA